MNFSTEVAKYIFSALKDDFLTGKTMLLRAFASPVGPCFGESLILLLLTQSL